MSPLAGKPHWRTGAGGDGALLREMPEEGSSLKVDSRWPAFFPSPICLVTTAGKHGTALEKVVGATIVNRFPYVMALSVCREPLSERHHGRNAFMELLESTGTAAIQFLAPGKTLGRAMDAIDTVPEERTGERIAVAGLSVRPARNSAAPVIEDAYMVYQGRLVGPGRDFQGSPLFREPWIDVGSHRVYFLEITSIELSEAIATGRSQIHWRALPVWDSGSASRWARKPDARRRIEGYEKPYAPRYIFPSANTVAFERDSTASGMAIKSLPPLPDDQVEVDNDRARWPCFFPSPVAMISTRDANGEVNIMPCGSTAVVSRHPMVISPSVCYRPINVRYTPRKTLELIRASGRFGCAVPYIDDTIVEAIRYAGNVSFRDDPDKLKNTGLKVEAGDWAPVLPDFPVNFECEVTGEVVMGTHVMFFGEVRRIHVHARLTPDNPLHWRPWALVKPAGG